MAVAICYICIGQSIITPVQDKTIYSFVLYHKAGHFAIYFIRIRFALDTRVYLMDNEGENNQSAGKDRFTPMKAVITVIGKDMVGILAKVSTICADKGVNVIEVTQSIMQDMFAMIMMVDISGSTVPFSALTDEFEVLGEQLGLKIHVMHEDVFNSMHRI